MGGGPQKSLDRNFNPATMRVKIILRSQKLPNLTPNLLEYRV